ncbi:MAG: hypothetical protein C1943_17320 [Halochromatium sp.]|nr:hypothetical protein [Halochromatium sp.]
MRSLAPLPLASLLFSVLACLLVLGQARAGNDPSIFLPNASAPRVKALALDTALLKGWTLVDSSTNAILFETSLDQPASDGPPGVTPPQTTQLLIRTALEQTETGTRVSASAEEHWWRGTERAWSADVTRRYGDNLQRALRSLQQRWERFIATAAPSTLPTPAQPHPAPLSLGGDRSAIKPLPTAGSATPKPLPSGRPALAPALEPAAIEPSPDTAPIGLWAYYAERYAGSLGCELHDRGAVLVQARQSDEIHRVYCTNRAPVMVRCDNLGCGSPR